MGKQLFISVSTPCHENWDAMTATDKGRFCAQCQKQVVDFTNMSDRQLADFLKKPSTGSLCGRFMSDQLNRAIDLPRKRIPWIKYFFQITLPAFLLTMKTAVAGAQLKRQEQSKAVPRNNGVVKELPEVVIAVAKERTINRSQHDSSFTKQLSGLVSGPVIIHHEEPPPPNFLVKPPSFDHIQRYNKQQGSSTSGSSDTSEFMYQGIVADERGERVCYATIAIKGTKKTTVTDKNGEFRMIVKEGYVLVVSCVGMETVERVVSLQKDNVIQMQTAVVIMNTITLGGYNVYAKKTKKRKKTAKADEAAVKCVDGKLTAFPNPVKAGESINIRGEQLKAGRYTLFLYDMEGRLVLQKDITYENPEMPVNTIIPSVHPGYYIVNLLHQASQKKHSVKIWVN